MAKCGHIFCLPCLIRYMHSDDDAKPIPEKKARWKKCPICWDSIYISETRPVRWYIGQEGESPREGGDVMLRLVVRAAGSTLALPRDGAESLGKDEDIPWYFAAEVMDYARIMKGSEDYMMEQYNQYIADLQKQEKEDELMFGEDNIEWMRKSIKMIEEGREKLLGIGNPPISLSKPPQTKPKRPPIVFSSTLEESPNMYNIHHASKSGQSVSAFLTHSDGEPQEEARLAPLDTPIVGDTQPNNISPENRQLSNDVLGASAHNKPKSHDNQPSEYYYYQALLHYYLSPLDIRILRTAFGSYASFPSTILPRVERVSTGHIVDDDLRKRAKYLAHLPYGCEVSFLECDWTDIVSAEVLDRFKAEIERRKKRNHEKESREEKARLRAEKEEDEKYAAARRKRPSIPHENFSAEDFAPLTASNVLSNGTASGAEDTSTSPPWPARRGQGFGPLASPSTSPSAPRTVWGTAAIPPSSPTLQVPLNEHDIPDDGWLQNWEKDLLQEEDMVAQAQALSLGENSRAQAGGKKKKAKKITLMSTNARRGA
jgi:hypothetical protein